MTHQPCFVRLTGLLAGTGILAFPAGLAAQTATPTLTLDTVVITAGGFEQSVAEAPASVTVISGEELRNGAFTSLTDALREVQGVVTTGVANEKDIQIRGLPGQYTLILVDGKRQGTRESRTNGSAGFEQSFIPPIAAIERIEVVRGPMSSLYGSDAMGGVINIITRPVEAAWTGSVTLEGTVPENSGFRSSRQLSFYAAGPVMADRLGLQIWGRKLDQSASSIESGPAGHDDFDLGGRLTWSLDDRNTVLLEGGLTRLTNEDYGDLAYRDNDRDHWSLTHEGNYGALTTELSLTQETGQRTSYSRTDPADAFARNLRAPQVRNTVLDAKGAYALDWHGAHNLTFGGQFIRTTVHDQNPGAQADIPIEDRYDEKFSLNQWALYAEDEWRLREDFALTAGLRFNHHESYGSHVTPRLYGVWNATDALTIKGGISTGFRAPDIRNIAPGYALTTGGANCSRNDPPSCGVILGNPDLSAEKTTNIEIGALYEASSYSLSATAYHTRFRDKLQQVNTGDLWLDGPQYTAADGSLHHYLIYRNFNVDRATIKGLELAGDWQVTDTLSARAAWSYTKSAQDTGEYKGFPLARTPRHMASLRLDWQTPVADLDVWAAANYHGSETVGGLRLGSNGEDITINGKAGKKYPAWTTVDLGGSYRITDTVTMNGAVYNLFDREVRASEFNTVEEGRRLWLGLTAAF